MGFFDKLFISQAWAAWCVTRNSNFSAISSQQNYYLGKTYSSYTKLRLDFKSYRIWEFRSVSHHLILWCAKKSSTKRWVSTKFRNILVWSKIFVALFVASSKTVSWSGFLSAKYEKKTISVNFCLSLSNF